MLTIALVSFVAFLSGTNAQSAPFTDAQIAQMRTYFEANIGVKGCATGFVVASPSGGQSHSSGDPDYYYHWQRDAAVSMHTLQYTATSDSDFDSKFKAYVTWTEHVQTESDPNGQNVLGEPKFNCDGSVFSGGWCRPQNDGPASRAIAQIMYANYLLDNHESDYVKQHLYGGGGGGNSTKTCQVQNSNKVDCGHEGSTQQTCEANGCCWYEIDDNPNNYPWCYYKGGSGGSGNGTIIIDLNYVQSVWNTQQTCDLWEEVRAQNLFYTLMVQRYALYYGSALALRMNDSATSHAWKATAASIDSNIKQFDIRGTIQDTNREWDCSVIVATLYGGTPDKFQPNTPNMFPPNDADILNTLKQSKSYFDSQFTINSEDDTAGIPGTLMGRYANDAYQGCKNDGGSKGHVWILCSNALADVYYRNALHLYENKGNAKEILSARHIGIYADLFEKDQPKAASLLRNYAEQWEDSVNGGYDIDYEHICELTAQMAASQGDNQLQRVSHHVVPCDMHMSEQICEVSGSSGGGLEVGAHDLTWSYGTVLSAWYYRGLALEAGVELYPSEKGHGIDDMVRTAALLNLKQDCGADLCNGQCKD